MGEEDRTDPSSVASSSPPVPTKKRVRADALDSAGDLRPVAEIVLVLSALGQMRGGRDPTSAEKALVAEAREKLASMCEGVRPKDLFSKEAALVLVEELGLNRSRDPTLGFRLNRLSIAEKLLLTKRKMEESKELATQPSVYVPNNFSLGFTATSKPHGTFLHGASKFQHDKSSPVAPHLGGPQSSFVTHGIAFTSAKQQTHAEAAHLRLDGQTQVRAFPAEYNPKRSSTSTSMQSTYAATSSPLAKFGQPNKSLGNAQMKSETKPNVNAAHPSNQLMRGHEIKASMVQAATESSLTGHQPPQGLTSLNSASLVTDHNDIAKYVQCILHATLSNNPSWIPPPIEYMNKPLNCPICKILISDTETLLVCDDCEGGYHLKCLQTYGNKGIPKPEWHCQRCLALSNGKPLPPKYGRVTRASLSLPQKAAPSAGSTHLAPDTKTENQDIKFNQQKVIVNGDSGSVPHAQFENLADTHDGKSVPDTRMRETGEAQCSAPVIGIRKEDGSEPFHSNDLAGAVCVSFGTQSGCCSKDIEDKVVSLHNMKSSSKSVPNSVSEITSEHSREAVVDFFHQSEASCDSQVSKLSSSLVTSADQLHENFRSSTNEPNEEVSLKEISEPTNASASRLSDQENIQAASHGALDIHVETNDCSRSLNSDVEIVEWVGDIIQVVEEKGYYVSCRINGLLYRLHDHVLMPSDDYKYIPSKLQSLWEDTKSGSKWATVSPYCFPNDLPDTVKQPSIAESSEVYATQNGRNIMTHLIRGPCEVLSNDNFREESLRRMQLGDNDKGLHPIFMCRWIYDESTCSFQSLSS